MASTVCSFTHSRYGYVYVVSKARSRHGVRAMCVSKAMVRSWLELPAVTCAAERNSTS
jgi:hypothetical protein